jgi:hypothetical protein
MGTGFTIFTPYPGIQSVAKSASAPSIAFLVFGHHCKDASTINYLTNTNVKLAAEGFVWGLTVKFQINSYDNYRIEWIEIKFTVSPAAIFHWILFPKQPTVTDMSSF